MGIEIRLVSVNSGEGLCLICICVEQKKENNQTENMSTREGDVSGEEVLSTIGTTLSLGLVLN